MKILFLCWRDTTHPQGGGSERYLERVGEYLVQHGHEVVYRTAAHDAAPRRQVRDGIRFSRAGGKFTVYSRAWLALLAGRLGVGPLRGVDVVVDTQNGIPFFARVFSGRPTVLLTHHCHREQWPVAGPVLSRVGWFLERRVAPRVYRSSPYVTVSESSAGELVELGVNAEAIRIIRSGIDPVPVDFARYPDSGTTHLVTLSRLVPHKQIEHAMDVIAALLPTHDVVLDVIGSGWWEQQLRDYAVSLGVGDRVILHGQVSEEHKHALLARATLHLMPSRKEGWGLAVIEAAQHGVPTLGYRSSAGLNDSVIDGVTGVLVDDKAALIRATADLIDDGPGRSRLGAAAERRATEFSWEFTGEQFAELLNHVAGRRR
ncbi:glycosyltransferase family 4 protein [Corynebacterium sp. CCM 9185]|uniref:Glycosyltransferase family 4 protein n=1 Tax=Corynebacterium marambiense TaxID=2765364 RepID=A0ABS0VWT5_9CORY|nr:glycosyltransferase family 4 protein [Corynebacterium marambiense]MBI9001241.1 glycosyltransferase family 4 protein [Corynebacterium marambiense]MCK7663797.1 glycosyltransferase family 4 protein [Corynebacterium marambiense]MCX7542945.1 glycosyltransferase family 4 protein [Corynebacterium marambiense]